MEFKKIIYISFLLTCLIAISFYIFVYNEMKEYDKCSLNYEQLYELSNTGDIIYFRWSCVDFGYRLFSQFSHVGIVYKVNNKKVYILETHPKDDYTALDENDGGVHVYDLKKRLSKYIENGGNCYYSQLNSNYTTSIKLTEFINKNIKEYKKIEFDQYFRYSFIHTLLCSLDKYRIFKNILDPFKLSYPDDSLIPMCCSQFIGYILQQYKLISDNENIDLFSPSTFKKLKQTNGNLLYNKIHKIK